MIGKLLYRLNRTFAHGLRAAYYRDVVRPRIIQTPPLSVAADANYEIHVLTSGDDYVNCLWSLVTFYHASASSAGLCVHDDGSLTDEHCADIQRILPHARVIRRAEADAVMEEVLRDYPRALDFRRENNLALKIFDFVHYLHGDRFMLLDSDVLFFERPAFLLEQLESSTNDRNYFNRGQNSAYTIPPERLDELTGIHVPRLVNSGLGVVHADSIRYDWTEEFLGYDGIHSHFWRTEQTLFTLCSARHGMDLLPPEYDVYLTEGLGERPCRHYVGPIRHLMYAEGLRRLVKTEALPQAA